MIFAGTTEGRRLSEILCKNKVSHFLQVATEYGKSILDENDFAKVSYGRMNEAEMEEAIKNKDIDICIDATHPFAKDVTENIRTACENTDTEYVRIIREDETIDESFCKFYKDAESLKEALSKTSGNILLTTGSKQLGTFCEEDGIKERLFVRVLPGEESIDICSKAGLSGKQIIAMQGPFSYELNKALINDLDIKIVVSKQSGKSGGFFEKLAACMDTNTELYVIGRPREDTGISLAEAQEKLNISYDKRINLNLIGVGMGSPESLLVMAENAIKKADIIVGAKRVISSFISGKRYVEAYLPKDILKVVEGAVEENKNDGNIDEIAVLFSGDSGFFSGAKGLLEQINSFNLSEEIDCKIIPGISSVSYFSACIGKSYDDAGIISIHGRKDFNRKENIKRAIKENKRTFILLSGKDDLAEIKELMDIGTKGYIGKDLGLSTETIRCFGSENVDEIFKELEEGLYIVCLENDKPEIKNVSGYIADEEFIRGKVPMTKSMIRSLSISRLSLKSNSVLFDIGAGTGSISIEAAGLSPDITVFAIEKKAPAIDLIKQNIEKFMAYNIKVIEKEAPVAFNELPAPTHAFIGGSSGNMKEIIRALYEKNPGCRVVINAVSYETLEEILNIKSIVPIHGFDISQVGVTTTNTVGNYNMLNAGNPVWICEFELGEEP